MSIKKAISSILCLAYLNASVARADQIDDLEKKVDEAIADYRRIIDQLLVLEKTNIAPTHIKEGIVNAFALTQNAMTQHIKAINSDFNSISEETNGLNKHLLAIKNSASSITIDGYQQLLSHKYAAELSIGRMKSLRSDIQSRVNVLRALTKGKDGFCENLSKKLDANNKPLESASVIVKKMDMPNYQGIDPRNFYDQSPFARGYALVTGAATFVAGVYLYAALNSVSIMAATSSLFGVIYESGGVAVSGTGWGAVIIIAAVIAAYLVGDAIAQHQNEEGEKRRDKALKKLIDVIESIQEHYRQTKMTTPQFQALGLELCNAEKLAKKPDGNPGLIYSKDSEWSALIVKADSASHELDSLEKGLDETNENLEKIAKQQEQYLRQQIAAEVIDNLNAKTINQDKVANGWLLYNENMKPISTRFSSFFASNLSDCFALSIEGDLRKSELNAASSVIKAEVANTGDLSQDLIAQVDKSARMISDSIESRLAMCK